MTPEFALSQGVAVGILLGVGWFIAAQLWPYFRERDTEERSRRHELACLATTTDEAMLLEMGKIGYNTTNPIRVAIVEDEH